MPIANRGLCTMCAVILAACVRDSPGHPPPGREAVVVGIGTTQTAGTFQGSAVASAVPIATAPTSGGGQQVDAVAGLASVVEAVRREDWRTARARLGAAPIELQRSREGRYLGGRIALALGDHG